MGDSRQILTKRQRVFTLVANFDSDRIYLSKRSKELTAMSDELENFKMFGWYEKHDKKAQRPGPMTILFMN